MKKFLLSATILSALTLTAIGAIFATAQAEYSTLSAYANTTTTPVNQVLDKSHLELLLPSSYEQYLALNEVNGIAVKGNSIAIADGQNIYVYNGSQYSTFIGNGANVSQVEWKDDCTLYFQYKADLQLYSLDCTQATLKQTVEPYSCNSFTLDEEGNLYTAVPSGNTITIKKNGNNYDAQETTSGTPAVPAMMYSNDSLFYSNNRTLYNTIYTTPTSKTTISYTFSKEISDFVINENTVYYTADKKLFAYDLNSKQERAITTNNNEYTFLSLDGNYLYVVKQNDTTPTSIQRFNITTNQFTDYEITTASTAPNRLQNGGRSVVSGNYLLTADRNRVVAYDFINRRHQSFSTTVNPVYIASNGDTFAVADGERIEIYDSAGALVNAWNKDGSITQIKGIAASKDSDYYFVGANGTRGILPAVQNAKPTPQSNDLTAKELTSDIEGNLYIYASDNKLYQYKANEFLSTVTTAAVHDFSKDVSNVTIDLFGNAYALDGNKIICSNGNSYDIDASGYLYGADTTLQAFALGYEYGEIYLIFGDYALSTTTINLPHLYNITAGNAYQTVFTDDNQGGVIKMVNLNQDAVFLHFNLDELTENATVFPYTSYSRAKNVSALVLGETKINDQNYYIVTTFSSTKRLYTAGLVKQKFCTAVNESEYAGEPSGFDGNVGFLTNDVTLYKYPYLTDKLTVSQLPKNGVVTVIKELALGEQLMDYNYYYVCFTETDGTPVYGYIPTTYLRAFAGDKAQNVTTRYQTYLGKESLVVASADGKTITLSAGVQYQVTAYYTGADESEAVIAYEEQGVKYYATVSSDCFVAPSTDVLRWFLVALISLAVVILVVNYVLSKMKDDE